MEEIYQKTVRQFFAPIVPALDDVDVSEILINGPNEIIVERGGSLHRTEMSFRDEESLMVAIRHLAQYVGRRVDKESPILEARLPDGSRVEAVIPPASLHGPHVAIRRFSKERLTMQKLLEFGALTLEAAHFLSGAIHAKLNTIVSGGTGSGKTSMLNALSAYMGERERIVVIEDSTELQLQHSHVVQFEAQKADPKGRGEVTIRDLFKATLRLRPDRIIVGEIRSGEALELVQAMTSGHGGCMSTVHASYPVDTLARLETMALMSDVELPLRALRGQISSAIDIVVQTSRLPGGFRGVTHISEVVGTDAEGNYRVCDIFRRCPDCKGQLRLQRVEESPRCLRKMLELGWVEMESAGE